jgi:soluble lytic murein transglycosylase
MAGEQERGRVRLGRVVFLALMFGALFGLARTETGREVVRSARDFPALRRVEGHRDVLLAASGESGVEPSLLAAVMFAESSGRVSARSRVGALGLFQVMLPTARERAEVLGLAEPSEDELLSDPLLNARLGADYLSWLLDRYDGHVERALIAYNAGPTKLSRWEEEAGGYAAWRAERAAAGNSEVLAYAEKVMIYRARFEGRGLFEERHETDNP